MRLIDADALKNCVDDYGIAGLEYGDEERERYVKNMIDSMATIDPIKHGHWIGDYRYPDNDKCSVCGKEYLHGKYIYKFCPSCGALLIQENDHAKLDSTVQH